MNQMKKIREEKGIKLEELAVMVGVSSRHIAFIERGQRTPSMELAFKIANVLSSTVDNIFLPNKCTKST